ncbi:CDGSH iron-sulfur domain-containing protein [Blastopirellula sp. J2-11]|uniref:CDGSH iron-sulfur domain-containing protein n=1 Tax=Blastopirellula sp. J2-11 TaxID=2943192 RepID=UPI0021C9E5F2|nr:CDGSH iron-sulfur domain-containing protein [Blastopirellula sp. J2-11]UUO06057.1 CDGSH iron-sulfur domain-containing protein [Blastopirellula sp. J2-11]
MSETKIRVRDNGPFLVEGPITLEDADGNTYTIDKPTIALCRCGHSANRPFCDGAHKGCGFESSERVSS